MEIKPIQIQPTPKVFLDDIAAISLGISTSRVLSDSKSAKSGEAMAPEGIGSEAEEVRFIQVRDIIEVNPFAGNSRPFEGRLLPMSGLTDSAPRLPGIKWDKFSVRTGDVLLTSKGSVLKTALVGPETSGAVATSNIIILRPDQQKVLPRVLLAIMRTKDIESSLMKTSRSSAMAVALNAKDVGRIEVPLPSMEVQQKLSESLEAVETYMKESLSAVDLKTQLVWMLVEQAISEMEVSE